MEPSISALYENHFEQFMEKCEESRELREAVYGEFASALRDVDLYELAFDVMYRWDAEYFVCSPLEAIRVFVCVKKERVLNVWI